MSFMNFMVIQVCKKDKRIYDPSAPQDYPSRREHEIRQNRGFRNPKGVSITYRTEGSLRFQQAEKEENPKDKIIYYIHGGGFVVGSPEARRPFTGYIADKLGLNVCTVDYPLAPEHPYPEGLDACVSGYQLLLEKYDAENIILMGESAGGNLVLALLLRLKAESIPYPLVSIVMSPCVQYDRVLSSYEKNQKTEGMVANLSEEVLDVYLRKDEALLKNPYVAPLYGDFTGITPVYLSASENELLYDDAVLMHHRLRECGVKCELFIRPHMVHAWIVLPIIPEAKKDIKRIKAIIRQYL